MDNQNAVNDQEKKKWKFSIPHVYVILFIVIIIAAIATYLVPAGEYDRIVNDEGRTIVVDGTYHEVDASPTGFLEIFQSIHKGMTNAAGIIFYIFIVGGAFGVLQSTRGQLLPLLEVSLRK